MASEAFRVMDDLLVKSGHPYRHLSDPLTERGTALGVVDADGSRYAVAVFDAEIVAEMRELAEREFGGR